MRRARTIALAGVGTVMVALGCETLVGIEDRSIGAADAGIDATVDASPDAAPDSAPDAGCARAFPPPKPTTDDGKQNLELYVAMRSIDLGIGDLGDGGVRATIGYDLDDLCTCPDPRPCMPFKSTAKECDDDAGRDNAIRGLFQTFAIASNGSFGQQTFNDALDQGLFSLIIRVSDYNGGANDTSVAVSVFGSNGTAMAADAGDAGANPRPAWDGNDVFTLDQRSVVGPGGGAIATAVFVDTAAYVANNVLVAHVDFPFRFASAALADFGAFTLSLSGGVITGRLVPEGATFRLDDGIIAGRWATKDTPEALAEFPDGMGGFTCPTSTTYTQVKPFVCAAADILADPARMDMSATCDALSVGFGFTAFPAQMGLKTARRSTSPCAGGPPDPCQ